MEPTSGMETTRGMAIPSLLPNITGIRISGRLTEGILPKLTKLTTN